LIRNVLDQQSAKGMAMAYGVDNAAAAQLILIGLTQEGDWLTNGTIVANPQVDYRPQLSAAK